MNIIKKIPNIKLDRNIIIYDNINYDEILAFKKKYKLENKELINVCYISQITDMLNILIVIYIKKFNIFINRIISYKIFFTFTFNFIFHLI